MREPVRARNSLAAVEERRYGSRVGLPRILRLLAQHEITATFFIPGWVAANRTAACRAIRDSGHEIAAHGNLHEPLEQLDRASEETILKESLGLLQTYLGVRPMGYRSPAWEMNLWSPSLLARHGFLYDSSLMGNDVPYFVDTASGRLIEVPVQWLLDDAPLYRHVYGASNAIADPDRVLQMWLHEFEGLRKDGGCFVLTCHPHISGRPSRVDVLDKLLRAMRSQPGVWFATCAEVATWTHASANDQTLVVADPERGVPVD